MNHLAVEKCVAERRQPIPTSTAGFLHVPLERSEQHENNKYRKYSVQNRVRDNQKKLGTEIKIYKKQILFFEDY